MRNEIYRGRVVLRRISNGMFYTMGEFEGPELTVFDMSNHASNQDPLDFEYVLPRSTYHVGLEVEVRTRGLSSSGKRGTIRHIGSTIADFQDAFLGSWSEGINYWHLHPVGVPVEHPLPPILRPTQLPLFRV